MYVAIFHVATCELINLYSASIHMLNVATLPMYIARYSHHFPANMHHIAM